MSYKFSLYQPLGGLKGISQQISSDTFELYKNKYGKPLKLKKATFYIASRTGINVKGIKPDEPALYVSNCLGKKTYFPYKIQNDMIKLFDSNNELGLLQAVKDKREVQPFNWTSFSTDSCLLGYFLNMFNNMETTPEWTIDTVRKYAAFNKSLCSGNAFGVFLPEYLATDGYDKYVKHTLLSTQYALGIGSLLIYENQSAEVPSYFIPDVDFITQFDLTKFMSLGLGQLYSQYNATIQNDEYFAEENPRCDCPRPNDIELLKKKSVTVKQVNTSELKLKDTKEPSVDKKGKEVADRLHSLMSLLVKELKKFNDNSPYMLYKYTVDEAIGDIVFLHMELEKNAVPYLSQYIPNTNLKLPENDAINKQYLVLNVTFKLINIDEISYTTSIGIYGTDNMGVECYGSSIKYKDLERQILVDNVLDEKGFIEFLVGPSFIGQFNELSVGFRESLFKGLESGMNNLKTALLLKTNESSMKVKEETCTENEYSLKFVDESLFSSISISFNKKLGSNSYKFILDVGKLGYTPSSFVCEYIGNENVNDIIEGMCKSIIQNLS